MERKACYIDGRICTGTRLSHCDECSIAKTANAELIQKAKPPLGLTAAHCLTGEQKKHLARLYGDPGQVIQTETDDGNKKNQS